MPIESRKRGTYITPETRSQDDKKLSRRVSRRQNLYIIGSYSIQNEEMDEVKEGRNTKLNFTMDFPGTFFVSVKYPTLQKHEKTI
jgi:hypothetical protein